ncbi:MAG: bestrophin family protein [Legionella sp.]
MNQQDKLQNQPEYRSFLKNALALNGSITPKVMKKVGFIVIYSCLVSYLSYIFPSIVIPIGPFEYGGLIMGLILVFRINAGYDRWWEARKLWGTIVNQSRNLSLILVNYTSHMETASLINIIKLVVAWPYLIKDNLRNATHLQYLADFLNTEDIRLLTPAKNRPLRLASMIAQALQTARDNRSLDAFSFYHAQQQLSHLVDAHGACERILKTPMPFVMAVKARRFILFFLIMLPFALVNVSLFLSPLIAAIVSYAIFSLDQIGIELQNPFSESNLSHLPLDSICKTIEQNLKETIELCIDNHDRSSFQNDNL